MKFYLEEKSDVLSELKTTEDGLNSSEAEERLREHGKNKLAEGKKTPLIMRFLKQIADPMIIILLVAAGISAVISAVNKEAPTDVFIILFVVEKTTIIFYDYYFAVIFDIPITCIIFSIITRRNK